jgi:hypothetical protein
MREGVKKKSEVRSQKSEEKLSFKYGLDIGGCAHDAERILTSDS